jgi:hypothetical protein
MAWVLRTRAPVAEVSLGRMVREMDSGVFEGTWVGDEAGPLTPLSSTTPFGSGVFADGDGLYLVPPGHTLEGVYLVRRVDELVASNSLVGLLVAAGLELDPDVAVGAEPIAARVERRKHRLAVFEPVFGSFVLRWAVSVVRPRYRDVQG